MKSVACSLGVAAALGALAAPAASADQNLPSEALRLRGPVAVVLADHGRWALTANRQGTISVIDVAARSLAGEVAIGRCLADLAATADDRLLAVDQAAGELIVLRRDGRRLEPVQRAAVGRGPVSVRPLSPSRAAVALLWDRQVKIVDCGAAGGPQVVHSVALPFNPRLLLPLADGARVLAADAFGGGLAVVDAQRGRLESARTIPGHNLRGLALSPDGRDVYVAHVQLAQRAETTRDNLHWGNLLSTYVRGLATADLLDPAADLLAASRLYPTSQTGHGAADPAALLVAPDGTLVMALGGAGELAIGPPWEPAGRRVPVGRRPQALALLPDQLTVCAADTLEDRVTLVRITDGSIVGQVALGPAPQPAAAHRGERLFYDARLSHEEWISCHSCHTDGHTSGLRSDTRGDGSFGAPKRTPTLLGVGATGPWAWDGSAARLADQLQRTMESTLHVDALAPQQLSDLAAFLATLPPPPPAEPAHGDDRSWQRGRQAFQRHGCADCHVPPAYTSAATYDVGLADEAGQREFNPPSLRGVGQARALYHDARAQALEEIFTAHPHATTPEVPPAERSDLLRFLRSL